MKEGVGGGVEGDSPFQEVLVCEFADGFVCLIWAQDMEVGAAGDLDHEVIGVAVGFFVWATGFGGRCGVGCIGATSGGFGDPLEIGFLVPLGRLGSFKRAGRT